MMRDASLSTPHGTGCSICRTFFVCATYGLYLLRSAVPLPPPPPRPRPCPAEVVTNSNSTHNKQQSVACLPELHISFNGFRTCAMACCKMRPFRCWYAGSDSPAAQGTTPRRGVWVVVVRGGRDKLPAVQAATLLGSKCRAHIKCWLLTSPLSCTSASAFAAQLLPACTQCTTCYACQSTS